MMMPVFSMDLWNWSKSTLPEFWMSKYLNIF